MEGGRRDVGDGGGEQSERKKEGRGEEYFGYFIK